MYTLKEIPVAITQDISRTENTAYIIVVPGFSHDDLAQQTCLHFEAFVQKLAQSQNTRTKIFGFQHGIRAESFESWDEFAEAGSGFLGALNNLRDQGELADADDLLLIGHGLGGFIVKKALVTAYRQLRHSKFIFETLAMLIMLGVPQLDSENKPDWIRLIKACVPKFRKMPSKLFHEESVLCLKAICDRFESFTIASPLVRVFGSLDSKPKLQLHLKRKSKQQGCINAATAVVREFTTSDPERPICDEDESHGLCALSENSAHHHILIAWTNEARQNYYLDANPDQINESQPQAQITRQLKNSVTTMPTELPLQTTDTSTHSNPVTSLAEPTEKSSDVVDSSEESTEESPREAFSGHSSASSDTEIENLSSRSGLEFAEPRLDTPSTSSLTPCTGPILPFTYLPLSRDLSFFGNNDTLQAIEAHLIDWIPSKTSHDQPVNHGRVCILHGVCGVGKSSIALETAYRTLDQFDCVFWIAADSESKVSTEIHKIVVKMNILQRSAQRDYSKSLSEFSCWLDQSETRSLVIFDNVESFPVVQGILPSNGNVSVLITTRDRITGNFLTGACSSTWLKAIEVFPFSLDEASDFLYQLAQSCSEADDPSACRILASKLSGLPLAIRHIAGLVNRRHLKFAECLELYNQNQESADLMWIPQGRSSEQQFYDSILRDTLEISFKSLSATATALLTVVSFLNPDSIAESILTSAQSFTEIPLDNFPRTVLAYTGARTELWNTSLCVLCTEKRRIRTHNLVQYQMRLHLSSRELTAGFKTASFLLLSQWPSKKKFRSSCFGNWPEFDDLQCHVKSLAKVYNELNTDASIHLDRKIIAPDSFVRVLVYSSWYNWHRGSPSEGKSLFDLAYDILTDSSIKSADSRKLKVSTPQITFTFKSLEGLLRLVDDNERIAPETNGDGGCEIISDMASEEKTSPGTPDLAVAGAHNSPQRSEKGSAKDEKPPNVDSEDLEDSNHSSAAQTEQIIGDGSEEGLILHSKQDSHADAYLTLEKGLGLIADKKYFEAVGSLMAVKDSVSVFQGATSQKYQIYLSACRLIGVLYWLNENMDLSLQTLLSALNLYQEATRKVDQDSLLHGQILFALGNVYLKTGHPRECLSTFSRAMGIFESLGEEGSDWIAVTRLKLADLRIQEQKHEHAHTLLQQCLSHFQSQSNLSAQAQSVRAIHRQALLYEVEGNEMMAKVFHAAARDGRAEYRRAKGIPDPEAGMSFEQKDLDADIEFWYR